MRQLQPAAARLGMVVVLMQRAAGGRAFVPLLHNGSTDERLSLASTPPRSRRDFLRFHLSSTPRGADRHTQERGHADPNVPCSSIDRFDRGWPGSNPESAQAAAAARHRSLKQGAFFGRWSDACMDDRRKTNEVLLFLPRQHNTQQHLTRTPLTPIHSSRQQPASHHGRAADSEEGLLGGRAGGHAGGQVAGAGRSDGREGSQP